MRVLKIIKDIVWVCIATAAMYALAAIILGWPLIEYLPK